MDRRGLGPAPGASGEPTPPEAPPDPARETVAWQHRAAARTLALFVEAARAVPIDRAIRLAGALGRSWARLGGPRSHDARINLRIAFPEASEAWRGRVLEASMANLARSVVEFAWIGRLGPEELRRRVHLDGVEHLEAARRASPTGGVVALTAHFGSWELLAAGAAASGQPLAIVHRPRSNPLLEELVNGLRQGGGTELLARGNAARAALRALKDGRVLAMPYDQNCGRREGVFVPFFGRLACARTAVPRIVQRAGVPVVPVFLHRQADGIHHVARVQPALPPWPSDGEDAVVAGARAMTRVVEEEIRRAPEQWAWIHRRWRTQPVGEPSPYP